MFKVYALLLTTAICTHAKHKFIEIITALLYGRGHDCSENLCVGRNTFMRLRATLRFSSGHKKIGLDPSSPILKFEILRILIQVTVHILCEPHFFCLYLLSNGISLHKVSTSSYENEKEHCSDGSDLI